MRWSNPLRVKFAGNEFMMFQGFKPMMNLKVKSITFLYMCLELTVIFVRFKNLIYRQSLIGSKVSLPIFIFVWGRGGGIKLILNVLQIHAYWQSK